LLLGVKQFNLASLSQELHEKVSVDFSLGPSSVNSLNFKGSSHTVIVGEKGLITYSIASEKALNSY
jgi:hypothetical protein